MMKDRYSIARLDWDSAFFHVESGKLVITDRLEETEMSAIQSEIDKFAFVTIQNESVMTENSKWIVQSLKACLTDINVHLCLKDIVMQETEPSVIVQNDAAEDLRILEIAEHSFRYSRFFNDEHIGRDMGKQVYMHWVKNAFRKKDKYFIISYDEMQRAEGFLLFSRCGDSVMIELIAVKPSLQKKGVGHRLMDVLKAYSGKSKIQEIHVGTQLQNLSAINFYTQNGFRIQKMTEIYHRWKEEQI